MVSDCSRAITRIAPTNGQGNDGPQVANGE